MTTYPNHQDSSHTPNNWQVDSFVIRKIHAEYIDSMELAEPLMAY